MLEQSAKIFVAGHRGLVGSAIWNNLKQRGYTNLTGRTHQELDLLDPMHPRTKEEMFFTSELPEDMTRLLERWRTYISNRE